MLYTIIRAFYGWDFLREAVASVRDRSAMVLVCLESAPWVPVPWEVWLKSRARTGVVVASTDATVIETHNDSPINHFTNEANKIIRRYGKPDEFLFMNEDQVFRADQLDLALKEFRERGCHCADTRQVEVWREFKHRVPERSHRSGAVLWNMRGLDRMPPTLHSGNVDPMPRLQACVHNMGFAVSPDTMKCKHEVAIGIAEGINDSPPNKDWYEKKWLNWTPESMDLEISIGYEHDIPHLDPYDPAELPEVIRGLLV